MLVIKYKSLKMNLVIGAVLNYKIWQIDYISTYLNASIQVSILMKQLKGYKVKPSKVYRIDINKVSRSERVVEVMVVAIVEEILIVRRV